LLLVLLAARLRRKLLLEVSPVDELVVRTLFRLLVNCFSDAVTAAVSPGALK
jgi:hypothetical protein